MSKRLAIQLQTPHYLQGSGARDTDFEARPRKRHVACRLTRVMTHNTDSSSRVFVSLHNLLLLLEGMYLKDMVLHPH